MLQPLERPLLKLQQSRQQSKTAIRGVKVDVRSTLFAVGRVSKLNGCRIRNLSFVLGFLVDRCANKPSLGNLQSPICQVRMLVVWRPNAPRPVRVDSLRPVYLGLSDESLHVVREAGGRIGDPGCVSAPPLESRLDSFRKNEVIGGIVDPSRIAVHLR